MCSLDFPAIMALLPLNFSSFEERFRLKALFFEIPLIKSSDLLSSRMLFRVNSKG